MSLAVRALISAGVTGGGWMLLHFASDVGIAHGTADVRGAGPQNMLSPPDDWDVVDQQADESFPASDPPGNY